MNKKEVIKKIETELKVQGKSPRTIQMYSFFNGKFVDFIKKEPEEITEEDVKSFLGHLLSEKNYDPASVALARSSLKFFYDGILKKKITEEIKTPKKQRKIPDVLTKEEVKQLIDAAKSLRNKLLIEFMYASGLRVSECVNLKKDNLNLNEKTGLLRKGKGSKDRFFILSNTLVKDLQKSFAKREDDNPYIFRGENGPLSVRAAQKAVQRVAKKAGIKKKVYCHLLRHAFATHLLESGVDIRKIQELLAHSNLQTTQFYTKVSTKELKKVKSPLDEL